MTDIRVYLAPLKGRVKAFTCIVDDFATIVINEALAPDARLRAYKHELARIEAGDFDAVRDGLTAGQIEEARHVV